MPTETNIEVLKGRQAAQATITDDYDDLSDGVTVRMQTDSGDASTATLYLSTQGAVALRVEFSPDGGTTWYEPADESPVTFDAAGDDLVFIDYVASHVRITAESSTPVRAALRVVA